MGQVLRTHQQRIKQMSSSHDLLTALSPHDETRSARLSVRASGVVRRSDRDSGELSPNAMGADQRGGQRATMRATLRGDLLASVIASDPILNVAASHTPSRAPSQVVKPHSTYTITLASFPSTQYPPEHSAPARH